MGVQVYRSTDAGAPVLTGQVGSLAALLDAVLVTGYGAKTAAGWSTGFSATNKRAYKQGAGGNNTAGMYFYLDDTGPGAGAAREARCCGFETMTAITPTGTGQFPGGSQTTITGSMLTVRKSTTADATPRPWVIVANAYTFYLFVETGDSTTPFVGTYALMFGDFKSYKVGDQYAVMIIGRILENQTQSYNEPLGMTGAINGRSYSASNTMFGHFIARHWSGLGGSQRCGHLVEYGRAGEDTGDTSVRTGGFVVETQLAWNGGNSSIGRFTQKGGLPYPHGPDGAMLVSPFFLNHSNAIRGYLYGVWAPLHDRPMNHNDTYTATSGVLNGKSVIAQQVTAYVNSVQFGECACYLIETSDTWS